ncbi:MAG: PIN domain-containing protein [Bacillota bacterium]
MRSDASLKGFLLDTTALIDFFRGQAETAALFNRLREEAPLALCPITAAEVYAGAKEKELPKVDTFLTVLSFYPITMEAARRAGRWRSSYAQKGITLNLSDALIAAVAVENGLALVTRNQRHYPMDELPIIQH